jgi:predicted DNA-binding transcriptional regulator AlpA
VNPPPNSGDRPVNEAEATADRWATDRLVSVADIRRLFKVGRTTAYELIHRPGFPAPVPVSHRCLRWWASEIHAYADTLQREGTRRSAHRTVKPPTLHPSVPRRITGRVRIARSRKEEL